MGRLVEMYAGREHELMPDVVAKYGPAPEGSAVLELTGATDAGDVGAGDVGAASASDGDVGGDIGAAPRHDDARRPAGRPTPTRTRRRRTFASGPS